MFPFIAQPALAPVCYKPRPGSVIAHSLLFRGAQSLSRIMVGGGNPRKFTIQGWFYRGPDNQSEQVLVSAGVAAGVLDPFSHDSRLSFLADGRLRLFLSCTGPTGGLFYQFTTTAAFVLPGWYAIKATVDTDNPSQSEFLRIEVDGLRQPGSGDFPKRGYSEIFLNGPYRHSVGSFASTGGSFYNGYAANVFMTEADISIFEQNIHGVVVPRPVEEIRADILSAGRWGVNGFQLDMSDAVLPGNDVSGNGNHFSGGGFVRDDVVAHSPTTVYATLQPLDPQFGTNSSLNFTPGFLGVDFHGVNQSAAFFTLSPGEAAQPVQFEAKLTALGNADNTGLSVGGVFYPTTGVLSAGGGTPPNGVTFAGYAPGDTITAEYNPSTKTVRFWKNASYQGERAATSVRACVTGGDSSWMINSGLRSPAYAVSSAKGLCTDAFPEPAVKRPDAGFAQAVATGAELEHKLNERSALWNGKWVEFVKRRDASENWRVRFGDDPGMSWSSCNSNAKAEATPLTAGGQYVGWRLRVGKRFGVYTAEVTHTTGTATTVNHGLGVARNVIIATRVSDGGGDRYMRHPDRPAALFKLNNGAISANQTAFVGCTADQFQLGATLASGTYRVLVLAEVWGFSQFGLYNSAGLPYQNPLLLGPLGAVCFMRLLADNNNGLFATYCPTPSRRTHQTLSTALPNAEVTSTSDGIDFTNGGVKVREVNAGYNAGGAQGIYMILGGRPIGGVCVAPATAWQPPSLNNVS